jgi:nucleoside phosphorylase
MNISQPQIVGGVRFWVISAWLPEQQFLREQFAGSLIDSEMSADILEVGEVGFLCTGVGAVQAAARVAQTIAHPVRHGLKPEAVLFVGTAGCYSNEIALNSAHFCSEVIWTDGDLVTGNSYLPNARDGVVNIRSEALLLSDSGLVAVSTPGITSDERLAGRLGLVGHLENLELFGVAQAARGLGINWGASLGVSNRVGANSHKEWKENHLEASLSAQRALLNGFLKGRLAL